MEEEGELKRIKVELDWNLEIGAIMRKVHDMEGPAVLFEKIKDYPNKYKFFCGGLATYSKYAIAMGMPKDTGVKEIIREYSNRIKFPIKPKIADRRNSPSGSLPSKMEHTLRKKYPEQSLQTFWMPRN